MLTVYGIANCDTIKKTKKWLESNSITWRKLSEEEQQNLDPKSALALIQRETSIIKRPIIHSGDQWLIGYDEGALARLNNP